MELGVFRKILDRKAGKTYLNFNVLDFNKVYENYRGKYGVVVILLAWIPGVVAVIHMLAFYR